MNRGEKIKNALDDAKSNFEIFQQIAIENKEEIAQFSNNEIVPTDVRKKLNRPEEVHMLAELMSLEEQMGEYEAEIIKNNRCSFSEYAEKFSFLHVGYSHSGCEDKKEYIAKRDEISKEFVTRFSINHPIAIYDDNDPEKILVHIPKAQRSLKLTKGPNSGYIDQFIRFADHDRVDVRRMAADGLIHGVMTSQQVSEEELMREQRENAEASINVLRVFYPDHPLLKEMDNRKTQSSDKESKVKTKNEDTDMTLEDFGF